MAADAARSLALNATSCFHSLRMLRAMPSVKALMRIYRFNIRRSSYAK